jgi:hypothetical protein
VGAGHLNACVCDGRHLVGEMGRYKRQAELVERVTERRRRFGVGNAAQGAVPGCGVAGAGMEDYLLGGEAKAPGSRRKE